MRLPNSAAELMQRCIAGGLPICVGVVITTPALGNEHLGTLDEVTALQTVLLQNQDLQTKNLIRHLTQQRYATIYHRTPQSSENLELILDQSKAAVPPNYAPANPVPRINLFAVGNTMEGDKNATAYEPAYDSNADYYTLGGDFRINDEWLAGIAYGHNESDLNFIKQGQSDNDRTNANTDDISVYASWYRKDFAVNMNLHYSDTKFTSSRSLPDAVAHATTDSQLIGMHLSGEFDFSYNQLSYGPLASIDLLDGSIEGYTEQSNSIENAQLDKQDVRSAILSMGAQAAYLNGFSWGAIKPYFKAICRYQIKNDRNLITGRLMVDPTTSFTLQSDKPDTTWFEFNAGLSAFLNQGISLYLGYEAIVDYRATNLNNISFGLNFSF